MTVKKGQTKHVALEEILSDDILNSLSPYERTRCELMRAHVEVTGVIANNVSVLCSQINSLVNLYQQLLEAQKAKVGMQNFVNSITKKGQN